MGKTSFAGGDLGSPIVGDRGVSHERRQVSAAINRRIKDNHHIPVIHRVIARAKAYFIVRGIKSALKEVDLIERGVIKPKSLDQLLNEL